MPNTRRNDRSLFGVFDEGWGWAVQSGHHGELVQGPVSHEGRLATAVVTLPRPDRFSVAHVELTSHGGGVTPGHAQLARRGAEEVLKLAGRNLPFCLTLSSNLRTGSGQGSSTADVLAAIRAACRAVGWQLAPEAAQHLCWRLEGASDPLLLARREAVVYGSRIGRVLHRCGRPLPALVCLGFDTAPSKEVLTEQLIGSERYTQQEVRVFHGILEKLCLGVARRSAALVGGASTASARLNQRRLATQGFDELSRLAATVGAVGLSVSHSGTVASFLFDPTVDDLTCRLEDAAASLKSMECGDIELFFPQPASGEECDYVNSQLGAFHRSPASATQFQDLTEC